MVLVLPPVLPTRRRPLRLCRTSDVLGRGPRRRRVSVADRTRGARPRLVPRVRRAPPGIDVHPGVQSRGALRRTAGARGSTGSHHGPHPSRGSAGDHMTNPIGPLTAADEGFCHQIVDTFAVVGSTDPSWTEKVCASAMARDGSLQLGFGLGKYNNRNVMDAYAGVSRGVEQITVRSSRRL